MEKGLTDYLNKVLDKMKFLKERHNKYSDEGCLFAYRGESKDYLDTSLMPSLFRKLENVQKEKYLFELLKDYGLVKNLKDRNMDQAIEAQHYVAISRMLDITFDLLVALYFACKSNEKENGNIFIFCFPEYYSPNSNYIEEFYTNVLDDDENITYASNFKVITHSFSNERIKAQKGGFIFFPGKEFRRISPAYYERIEIAANDKKQIVEELDILFRINEANLFPSKENYAKIIKEKFKQANYYKRKVSVEEEVKTFLTRLEYELAMIKRSVTWNKQRAHDTARMIRKEESDLLYYVENIHIGNKDGEKADLTTYIKERFGVLQVKYGGDL